MLTFVPLFFHPSVFSTNEFVRFPNFISYFTFLFWKCVKYFSIIVQWILSPLYRITTTIFIVPDAVFRAENFRNAKPNEKLFPRTLYVFRVFFILFAIFSVQYGVQRYRINWTFIRMWMNSVVFSTNLALKHVRVIFYQVHTWI